VFNSLSAMPFLAQVSQVQQATGGAVADGVAATGGAPMAVPQGDPMSPLIMIGLMIVIFYFFIIRPQSKRAKKHRELVGGLKKGDQVITSSGIYGTIRGMDGEVMTLEVAKNTHIKVLKSYVGGLANAETEKELAQTAGQA
jgi:preprotein translocase subunit YajC